MMPPNYSQLRWRASIYCVYRGSLIGPSRGPFSGTLNTNAKRRMSGVSKQSPVVGEASTWFDLGCELSNAKRHQEALSAFEQVQEINPDFPGLRFKIAYTHFELGNFTRSLSLYEALARDTPRDGNVWT